jgi:hypothetical protein
MRRAWLASIAIALTIVAVTSAFAEVGDKAGWSVLTDPRQRAFLIWVPAQDGPRVLMLGCLRDAGTFTTMSDVAGEFGEIARVKLSLSTGAARFDVDGSITRYPRTGRATFISDLDVDDAQMRALGRRLMPVLQGPGDLTLTIAPGGSASGAARTSQIPIAGLAPVLARFRDVCFG